MPIRETQRIVKISGRTWKIEKFDALTGSYIAVKMISRLSHIAVGIASGNLSDPSIIAIGISEAVGSLQKSEFFEIQNECLNVVKEIQKVGDKDVENPLRLPDGRWSVSDLESNVLLIMALVTHVLIFNLTPFFDGNTLKELKDSFEGLMSFSVPT